MKPRNKGNKWEVQYRVPGYPKAFYERFDTEVEARLRCAQIEIARKNHRRRGEKQVKLRSWGL